MRRKPAPALQMMERSAGFSMGPRVWAVGALCQAVSDALEARFNPVAVHGELSGFARAASGHWYFNLKDASGQIRCAMFRRAASLVDFAPREGEQVEVRGRLGVYGVRGELQLVAESLQRVGAGALYEQFLQRKAKLEAEGLFDADRKRVLPALPRGIGLVTSLGAAALRDVAATLARRVPHVPVTLVVAAVQGPGAPAELMAALSNLYQRAQQGRALAPGLTSSAPPVDVIVLVRGGGAIEDLWAFNDEGLARHIAASPVPVIVGVGHETDTTLADFVADLRAPTPTAAAEMVAAPRAALLAALDSAAATLVAGTRRALDRGAQRLDTAAAHIGRPSVRIQGHAHALHMQAQALRFALRSRVPAERARLAQGQGALARGVRAQHAWQRARLASVAESLFAAFTRQRVQLHGRLQRAQLRLDLLDPQLVFARGYAWLHDGAGHIVCSAAQVQVGQALVATLAAGSLEVAVTGRHGSAGQGEATATPPRPRKVPTIKSPPPPVRISND